MKKVSGSLALALFCLFAFGPVAIAETPDVGAKLPDFTLSTPEGKPVHLNALLGKGDIAVVVLRGYPGYQCPFCMKQVHDLEANADKFAAKGIRLLLIYPGNATTAVATGPAAGVGLGQQATEFVDKTGAVPANFDLTIDPDFKVTNLLGLRWDAPRETAYPTTFLIDKHGAVLYRKISRVHGDRASAEEILTAAATAKR